MFHFRVWIDVFHNDRDLEFIQFKRWCESLYNSDNSVLSLDHKSCEMIADDLYIQIATRYPGRVVHIEVAEDGENGALIRYELNQPLNNIVI
jgi:tRNA isopentenyl-2-thiomethyl-A-37 hydroxylase MiaE